MKRGWGDLILVGRHEAEPRQSRGFMRSTVEGADALGAAEGQVTDDRRAERRRLEERGSLFAEMKDEL